MHTRRVITFLLGVWFASIILIALIASANFSVAHSVATLPPPEAARAVTELGAPMTEQLLRFLAAETNRKLFEVGGLCEIGLLFGLLGILLLQNYGRRMTVLAGVLVLAALASHFLLTPQVVSLGRILDFRAAGTMLDERARFANMHMAFGMLGLFRLGVASWLTGILLVRGPNTRVRRRRGDVDEVDHAEDRHINR